GQYPIGRASRAQRRPAVSRFGRRRVSLFDRRAPQRYRAEDQVLLLCVVGSRRRRCSRRGQANDVAAVAGRSGCPVGLGAEPGELTMAEETAANEPLPHDGEAETRLRTGGGFRAWLQLVRLPAVFTALADVAAGF